MTPHRMGPTTTAVPDGNRAALATAHAALRQGCHFLSARSEGDGSGGHRHARLRWRVAGNHLKELDRFLAVLLAEYAQATGHARPPLTPPIPDSLAPAPDSAEALARLEPALGPLLHHMPRLRAIGRIRNAACDGEMGAAGSRLARDWAIAAGGGQGMAAGAPFTRIDAAALAQIAQFYLALADQLRSAFARTRGGLDFS